jgi:hypothetical protein
MLTYTGQLAGKRVSTYKEETKVYLQFMQPKADGSIGFMEFRCEDGVDPNRYRVGEKCTVPVEFKHVKDKLYWNVVKETAGIGTPPRP